jgi:hypothetical protein
MIRDLLTPALIANFQNRGFRSVDDARTIGIFPAAHCDVGNLTIWDDKHEATIGIGDITHGHFNPYDNTLTDEQVAQHVTEDVIEFLTALFADRVLLWKSLDNRSGGWRRLDYETQSRLDTTALTYLWSGPVSNPDIIGAG